MARRRKKRRGGKSKSIPVLPMLPIVMVAKGGYDRYGLTADALNWMGFAITGYDAKNKSFNASVATPFWLGEITSIVVHKVANKTGVNRYVRKATFGYLSL